jgi:hypothetical protein
MHDPSYLGVVHDHDAGLLDGICSRYDVRRWCSFGCGCFGSFAHHLFVRCSCRCRRLESYNPFRTACRISASCIYLQKTSTSLMELTVTDHSVLASRALELRGARNYRAGCFSSQVCFAQRESHQCVLHETRVLNAMIDRAQTGGSESFLASAPQVWHCIGHHDGGPLPRGAANAYEA